jgi:ACS family hexuronate transporter-like MFS transporter
LTASTIASSRWHWLPIGVFTAFAVLNMLDRQLLAALAPTIRAEFGLNNTAYGALSSVFSVTTALASPLTGLLLDRIGLTLGACVVIFVWSLAGAATGFTHSLRGLIACRIGLAAGESGGGAAPGIVLAQYMDAGQRGVGAAFLASGTSLGAIAAPLVVAALTPRFGWRAVFVICGVLGLLWIPVWAACARLVPPRFQQGRKQLVPIPGLLTDPRFWGTIAAYALARQTLWVSWTTLYFVDARHLTMLEANQRFSWYPSVFGATGAFIAGAIALLFIRRGMNGVQARLRTSWLLSPLVFLTALVPFIESNSTVAILIGVSFVGSVCIWTSTHLMPIDIYGVGRSAFTYAALEGGFAGVQMFASPAIGAALDRYGYTAVCLMMPWLPMLGLAILTLCLRYADRRH